MNKKTLITICVLIMIIILTSGCGETDTAENINSTNNSRSSTSATDSSITNATKDDLPLESETLMKIDIENRTNISYDNTTDKEHFFKKEYELNEIKNFFGEMTYFDASFQNAKTFKEIDSAFPILFLRNIDHLIYTMYSVKEGGLFYVFFLPQVETNENGVLTENAVPFLDEGTCPIYFAYLPTLDDESSFKNIIEGTSTAEEVKKAVFSFQMDQFRSCGWFSYSLLKNGNVVEIEYKKQKKEINSLDNFIVYKKQILTDETSKQLCYLSTVLQKDLPG